MQTGDILDSAIREILKNAAAQGLEILLRRGASSASSSVSGAVGNSSSIDQRAQVLRDLMQALDCNEESICRLKEAIANTESGKAAVAELLKKIKAELPQSVEKQIPVIGEELLRSPEKLAEILSKTKTLDLKLLLDTLRQQSVELQVKAEGTREEDKLTNQKTVLKAVQEGSSELRIALETKDTSALTKKLAEIIETRQGENPAAGKVERPIQKLCEILRSLPKVSSELLLSSGEKAIQTALRQHLELVRAVEQELRAAVEAAFSENPLKTLLGTVVRAEKAVIEPQSEVERVFVRFVSALRTDIENLAKSEMQTSKEARAILGKALQTIEEEIRPRLFGGPNSQVKENGGLSHKAQVLLRSIEAQIATLVAMPDDDLRHLLQQIKVDPQTQVPDAVKNINRLFEEIRQATASHSQGPKNVEAFMKQISALQMSLVNAFKEAAQPEQLKNLLNDFMIQLKALPALLRTEDSLARDLTASGQFSMFKSLKEIEGALKALLHNVAKNEESFALNLFKESIFQQLMKQMSEMMQIELAEDGAVEQLNLRRFVLSFTQRVQNALQPGTAVPVLREVLEEALKEVRQLISRQNPTANESQDLFDTQIQPNIVKLNSETLKPAIEISLKQILMRNLQHIEKQIQEIIKLIDVAVVGERKMSAEEAAALLGKQSASTVENTALQEKLSREFLNYKEQEMLQQLKPGQLHFERLEQRALLLKDPGVMILLKGMKNLDLSLLNTGSGAEKHFIDFLKELAQKVPAKDTVSQKDTLSRKEIEESLAKLDRQFRFEQVQQPVNSKEIQLKNMVAALEQAMKGQELLDRLNTVMNILGEPAMFLFPSIIQGFASQLEFMPYPMTHADEVENYEKEGEKKEKKGKYKRFEFNMSFTGLGRIQTKAMFRDGEFLLDVCAENAPIATFLEARFPKFEAFLRSIGYSKTELRISVKPFEDLTPSWVPALLGADGSSRVVE